MHTYKHAYTHAYTGQAIIHCESRERAHHSRSSPTGSALSLATLANVVGALLQRGCALGLRPRLRALVLLARIPAAAPQCTCRLE